MRSAVNKYLKPATALTLDYSSIGGRKMIESDLLRRNIVAQSSQQEEIKH
jgi:hypothetical protein